MSDTLERLREGWLGWPIKVKRADLEALLDVAEAAQALNAEIPRDGDGRPILGIANGDDWIPSNWVAPFVAKAAQLCAVAASLDSTGGADCDCFSLTGTLAHDPACPNATGGAER